MAVIPSFCSFLGLRCLRRVLSPGHGLEPECSVKHSGAQFTLRPPTEPPGDTTALPQGVILRLSQRRNPFFSPAFLEHGEKRTDACFSHLFKFSLQKEEDSVFLSLSSSLFPPLSLPSSLFPSSSLFFSTENQLSFYSPEKERMKGGLARGW